MKKINKFLQKNKLLVGLIIAVLSILSPLITELVRNSSSLSDNKAIIINVYNAESIKQKPEVCFH